MKVKGRDKEGSVSLDEAILHVDVCMEGLVVIDDPSAFDQESVALLEKKTKKRWNKEMCTSYKAVKGLQVAYSEITLIDK